MFHEERIGLKQKYSIQIVMKNVIDRVTIEIYFNVSSLLLFIMNIIHSPLPVSPVFNMPFTCV